MVPDRLKKKQINEINWYIKVKLNSKVKEMIIDLKYISFYSHNKKITILHNNLKVIGHTLD